MNSRRLIQSFFEGEKVAAVSEAMAPISRGVLMKMLRAYGRSPRVMDFFTLYGDLKDLFDSGENPGDSEFYLRLKRGLDHIDSRVDLEATRNKMDFLSSELLPILRRIDGGFTPSSAFWRRITDNYSDLIQAVGADKQIFMSTRRLPGKGVVRWRRLQRSSAKEEAVEVLRREDPDLYARMQQDKQQREIINDNIRARILEDGMEPGVRVIANRPVMVGIGPAHDPANKIYDLMVYDIDGEVLQVRDFADKIKNKKRSSDALLKINPADKMYFTQLDKLRKADLESLAPQLEEVETEFISLTDDPHKDTALTRIYEVKKLPSGEKVVVGGRFRGFFVADLVNRVGRQVEGSIYAYDWRTRRIARREATDSKGRVTVANTVEPYVTVNNGKLFLVMSFERMYKRARNGLKELSKTLPSLYEPLPKTRPGLTRWYFEPKDFSSIREVVGGMTLSHAAAKMLRDYFDDLSKAERASQAENLSRYNNVSLGFKDQPNRQIRSHVKRALAWLDANDNRGICALDTGMGKTVVAIAAMQNLIKKGDADTGNGRFLYVCPKELKGNLPKEIYKFIPREEAQALLDRVDIINYGSYSARDPGLNKRRRDDPTFGDDYVAIFFDEAHTKMSKKTGASYKAAVNIQCQHKVLMTASPMVRSPKEVITMASVGNSEDLNTPEGRRNERQFITRFSNNVGGRITGITDDKEAARSFRVWVKRNLFFADKRDVEEEPAQLAETGLGGTAPEYPYRGRGRDLRRETVAVSMPPSIETAYRETMDELMAELRQWERWSIFEGDVPLGIDVARTQREIKALLKRLTLLSDTPDAVIPEAGNPKIDRAVSLVQKNVGKRTLLFAESEKLVMDLYARLQRDFPAQGVVAGLGSRILYRSPEGKELIFKQNGWKPTGEESKGQRYRPLGDPISGRVLETKEDKKGWATFTLEKMLGLGSDTRAEYPVMAAALSGKYAVGQNLQSFGTVIHMDRDSWNAETMKQRTARAWRAGNKQPVDEYTLDMVYPDVVDSDDADETLDDIRRIIQNIDADLFDRVVLDSQVEKLGEEWGSIKQQRAALHQIDRKMMVRALSPYAGQIGREDEDSV